MVVKSVDDRMDMLGDIEEMEGDLAALRRDFCIASGWREENGELVNDDPQGRAKNWETAYGLSEMQFSKDLSESCKRDESEE